MKSNYSRQLDKLRQRLLATEVRLRSIAGDDPDILVREAFSSRRSLETIGKLLFKRCRILNGMFIGTENEMAHLRRVNDHLLKLRNKLHARTTMLANTIVKDPEFDDDYEVEGTLMIPYNDEDSVLSLEEDDLYGSDFRLMNSILDSYYRALGQSSIGWGISPDMDNFLDDGHTWSDPPFDSEEFDNIVIGYALHDLCNHKHYSVPDIIRLNDFWAEAAIVAQSITGQTGNRFR